MGLDWIPTNKPRQGHEREFWALWEELVNDECADLESAHQRYEELSIQPIETLQAHSCGPACDGTPRYSNSPTGAVGPDSFRAECLVLSCEEIIGPELLDAAFEYMRPAELAEYGNLLRESALDYAKAHNVDVDNLEPAAVDDIESLEARVDMVLAASRWCLFWASNGHALEPSF
ncbi:MAG: hypothetical protein U0271_24775 [Polyangiaceae bacterium]